MLGNLDLQNLKIATARALVCICEADKPMSAEMLTDAITSKYDKRYDDVALKSSLRQLHAHGLIDDEFSATEEGLLVYGELENNKACWAEKFFRKSKSPNAGPRVSPAMVTPPTRRQSTFPFIVGLNPSTW